jgi:hypothetical protein
MTARRLSLIALDHRGYANYSAVMRLRRGLALVGVLVVLPLAACGGGGNAFGCTGETCKAVFDGPGEQDLSSALGSGATVEVVTVDAGSVTAHIAGKDAKLVKGEAQRVAGYRVTLTEVDGEDVTLRVVGE